MCYNGREGWAPSSFLELVCSTEVDQSIASANEEQSELVTREQRPYHSDM